MANNTFDYNYKCYNQYNYRIEAHPAQTNVTTQHTRRTVFKSKKVHFMIKPGGLVLSCLKLGSRHIYLRMVIEILERRGGDLLFSSQNLQDCSDCAKNRVLDSSWVVIDDKILFYTNIFF